MMDNLPKRVAKLEKDVLKMKNTSNTVGDSATAYQEMYDLGDYPRDNYNHYYVWDFYFEPVSNAENFVLTPIISECYGKYSGDVTTSPLYLCFGGPDINDPTHIMVFMGYLPSSGWTIKGSNVLTVTANVDFVLKSSNKSSKTF